MSGPLSAVRSSPVPAWASRLAPFLALLLLVVPCAHGGDVTETQLVELLHSTSVFDGRHVIVRGVLTRLQTNVSRKGDRYYTFQLTQDAREVLILSQGRPACRLGSLVTVEGRFEGSGRRVDASVVRCEERGQNGAR